MSDKGEFGTNTIGTKPLKSPLARDTQTVIDRETRALPPQPGENTCLTIFCVPPKCK
jgi:hypothetical protein